MHHTPRGNRLKYRHILLLTVLVALLSFSAAAAQTPTPNPDTILQDCADNLPPDRPMPTGQDAPSIKIVSPASGAVIRGDDDQFVEVNFTVEVENFDLADDYEQAEAGNHWHLWLNNSIWGMYGQTTVTSYVMYGTWRICASIGDADHADLGMPDAILLIVERTAGGETQITVQPAPSSVPSTPVPPTPTAASPQPSASTSDSVLPQLLIVGVGVVALLLGLWFGSHTRRK
jgi:hypothetical protein